MFRFSIQSCSEKFLILRRMEGDIILNLHIFSYKAPVVLIKHQRRLKFLGRVLINPLVSNFMKIYPVRPNLFHADRRTDRETDRLT